jgi:hypothetical protein
MTDDDVRTHGYVKLLERAAMKVTLDAAQWLAEFRKIFEVTEGMGYRTWGVATDGTTRAVYPFYPFRWRSYVTASCMGIINDGRTYFDDSYAVKEDYELCARYITEDGGVVCAQYVFWVNNHWHDDGGCKDYRTQAMEEDCIKRLRRAYPNLVRVAQRTDNRSRSGPEDVDHENSSSPTASRASMERGQPGAGPRLMPANLAPQDQGSL